MAQLIFGLAMFAVSLALFYVSHRFFGKGRQANPSADAPKKEA